MRIYVTLFGLLVFARFSSRLISVHNFSAKMQTNKKKLVYLSGNTCQDYTCTDIPMVTIKRISYFTSDLLNVRHDLLTFLEIFDNNIVDIFVICNVIARKYVSIELVWLIGTLSCSHIVHSAC